MKKLAYIASALLALITIAFAQVQPGQSPLTVSKGGTGLSTASANMIFSGPTSGGAAAPTWRGIVPADITTALTTPPPIGGTTPAAGAFTTLSASSTVSGSGFSTYLASPPAIGGSTPAAGTFTTATATTFVGALTGHASQDLQNPNIFNVMSYGAKGDSNGTHGNGTDDTTAFQNAMNAAAGSSLYIPCGTYRLTAPVTVTDTSPRYIFGAGACTKIFSDNTIAANTFTFSPGAGTCGAAGNRNCVTFRDAVFLTPNTVGSGQVGINFTNENGTLVEGVDFVGQQVALSYTTSFSPRIIKSRFFGGVGAIFSIDTSFNSGEIASNGFFNQTQQAVYIVPAAGCADSTSVHNNDFEGYVTGLELGGVCGGSVVGNYFEGIHTSSSIIFTGTTNANISFIGNYINGATDAGTGSFVIQHVARAYFMNNYFNALVVTIGTGGTSVYLRSMDNGASGGTTFPATTVACTGYGVGGSCVVVGDDYSGYIDITTAGTPAATGTITLTFTNALGPNHTVCTWIPGNGAGGSWTAPVTAIATSFANTSNAVSWTNGAALTTAVHYLFGYQCNGS